MAINPSSSSNSSVETITDPTQVVEISVVRGDALHVYYQHGTTGNTGHWYAGNFYGGTFNGHWYSGSYYNGKWQGKNHLNADQDVPPAKVNPTANAENVNVIEEYKPWIEEFIKNDTEL